jgi:hypothetical protein
MNIYKAADLHASVQGLNKHFGGYQGEYRHPETVKYRKE